LWHFANKLTALAFVAYWSNSRQRPALALSRYAAIDPLRTWPVADLLHDSLKSCRNAHVDVSS
jgi:hypothetical protein